MKAPPAESPAPAAEASPSPSPSPSRRDVVLVHGVTEDGAGLQVLRARDDHVEQGALRPLVEGQPIRGDVVRLHQRREHPFVFDVDTVLAAPGSPAATEATPPKRAAKGPPQVASASYRDNWDRIWPSRRGPEPAN